MVNRQNRAKQFLPFDALKGLQEALREKEAEIEIEERKELSEESLVQLQEKLYRIEKGNKVKIKYYKNRKYINVTSIIFNIDYIKKKIILDNDIRINICDIIEIEFFY